MATVGSELLLMAFSVINRIIILYVMLLVGPLRKMGNLLLEYQTVDEYLNDKQRLASDALDVECYCDLPLLQAAAIAYRQPVNLYSRNDNNAFDVFYDLHELRPTNALAETEPITLVHFGAHYEVLVPAADEESQNENQAVCFF
jgi:hypothetical protein